MSDMRNVRVPVDHELVERVARWAQGTSGHSTWKDCYQQAWLAKATCVIYGEYTPAPPPDPLAEARKRTDEARRDTEGFTVPLHPNEVGAVVAGVFSRILNYADALRDELRARDGKGGT